MSTYTSAHSEAPDDGRIPAHEANINDLNNAANGSGGPIIIEVIPSNPEDRDVPLYRADSEDLVDEVDIAKADLIFWINGADPNQAFIRKNSAGPEGWVDSDYLNELLDWFTRTRPTTASTEETPATLTLEQEPNVPACDAEVGNVSGVQGPEVVTVAAGDGGPTVPPTQVAEAGASDPGPKSEAVVKLAAPVTLEGPHFRDSDGSPFDLKSSSASYIYGFDATNSAVVLRNAFGRRSVPYRVRPPLASNEAALAERLHGQGGEELKARVRGTAIRTGPATPVAAWTEMLAAFTLFPSFLDELDLDEETLDAIIKLLHNGGFMKSQKADHHGCYFQIADASALEIEVRGQGKLPWVSVGPREPDELMRLALLVKLLNYKSTRSSRNRADAANAG